MKICTFEKEELNILLPAREVDTHKGHYGRILMLCGSVGYTGAAALATMGALRTGTGVVYLGVPESIYPIMAAKLTEPVVFPLPDDGGMISNAAVQKIEELLPRMDAVLIGPGLGVSNGIRYVTIKVLTDFAGPVVLDADGINVLKEHMDVVRDRTGSTILTPHMGEFQRVYHGDISCRENAVVEFARLWNCILLLKGNETLITDGRQLYRNTTGNPGMATGGSGDVLAGIITSFLGQGIDHLMAAVAGAYLHGAAGDHCAVNIGQYGMLPSDILQVLPKLLK